MRCLHVGGVVAIGFDPSGEYLLVISHNGRGVFSTRTWERLARDPEIAYPIDGYGVGIGPIAGASIAVTEKGYDTEKLTLSNSDVSLFLKYDDGTITVSGVQ